MKRKREKPFEKPNLKSPQNNSGDILDYIQTKKPALLDLGRGVTEEEIKNLSLGNDDAIGIKLNIPYELLFAFGIKKGSNKNLQKIKQILAASGYTVTDTVAAYPTLNNPRFILPFNDKNSHRFLFNNLILPRRYSLTLLNRSILKIYCWLLQVMKNPKIIHRFCYLLIARNENFD